MIIVGLATTAYITIREFQVQRSVYASILDQKLTVTSDQFRYYLQPVNDDLAAMNGWWQEGLLDPTQPEAIAALQSAADGLKNAAHAIAQLNESGNSELAGLRDRGQMDNYVPGTKPEILLSARDVAARLGVDPKTVRRWREAKKLPPAIDVAGVLRWRSDVIESWLRELEGSQR